MQDPSEEHIVSSHNQLISLLPYRLLMNASNVVRVLLFNLVLQYLAHTWAMSPAQVLNHVPLKTSEVVSYFNRHHIVKS